MKIAQKSKYCMAIQKAGLLTRLPQSDAQMKYLIQFTLKLINGLFNVSVSPKLEAKLKTRLKIPS